MAIFIDGAFWHGHPEHFTFGKLGTYWDEKVRRTQQRDRDQERALQDAGYYSGPITGSLSGETRLALASFQRDYGLPISGAIDEPTVDTLGLYEPGPYQVYDVPNSN